MSNNQSALYKFFNNYAWEGVQTEAYKQEKANFSDIIRKVIIGAKEESCLFDVRYFEIAEGGFSSLEKHQHEHVVICVRGKGKVLLNDTIFNLDFLDIVYISPHTPHQLINEGKEPFGFFCIVNSVRDKPQMLA